MSDAVQDKSEARDSLKSRLAAARAARVAAEAPTEAEEDAALVAELEREERLTLEVKARRAAKQALGNKFAEVMTPMGLVILKRSGVAAFKAMQESEGALGVDQLEEFVTPCVFYPERSAFEKIAAELPGALPAFFRAVSVLMGAVQAEQAKK